MNICSSTKMPQLDSNRLGRFGLPEAVLACYCSFNLEYVWQTKQINLGHKCGPMGWTRSKEMFGPADPKHRWDPHEGVTHTHKETFLLLPNVRGSLSAQASIRKFVFSPKGTDFNNPYHSNTKGQVSPTGHRIFRLRIQALKTYTWYLKKNGSEEPRGSTAIKTKM